MYTFCKHPTCKAIIALCYTECSKCNPNRVNHMAAARKKKEEQ